MSVVEVSVSVTCENECMVVVIPFIWIGLSVTSVKLSEQIIEKVL